MIDATVKLLLIAMTALLPVLLARRMPFVFAVTTSLVAGLVLSCLWFYWPHLHADLRLQEMGFDPTGMTDAERVKDVPIHLQERAVQIYNSHMGVGWPLQALAGMLFVLPYILAAVVVTRLLRRRMVAP